MKQRIFISVLAWMGMALALSGCSSFGKTMKSWVSGKESPDVRREPQSQVAPQTRVPGPARFSENENMRVNTDRQYRKMNRSRFEEQAELGADAGSLWVMEGQGAYLFSQNQIRVVGDLLNVRIEGGAKSQLQTKIRVISRLLERLDNPRRGLASKTTPGAGVAAGTGASSEPATAPAAPPTGNASANQDKGQGADAQTETTSAASAAGGDVPFNVASVPTRIVEQLKDGSYRVRGMQPFMIGKREYKVIVTGIVRGEDFDDAGLDASKLLDSQFDIVSSRKGAAL